MYTDFPPSPQGIGTYIQEHQTSDPRLQLVYLVSGYPVHPHIINLRYCYALPWIMDGNNEWLSRRMRGCPFIKDFPLNLRLTLQSHIICDIATATLFFRFRHFFVYGNIQIVHHPLSAKKVGHNTRLALPIFYHPTLWPINTAHVR